MVFDGLATGCVLAILRERLWADARYRHVLESPRFFLVPLAVVVIYLYTPRVGLQLLFGQTLIHVGIALCTDWAMRFPKTRVGRFLNSPPLVWVGVASYSLYLWQQLFLCREHAAWYTTFPQNLVLASRWRRGATTSSSSRYIGPARPGGVPTAWWQQPGRRRHRANLSRGPEAATQAPRCSARRSVRAAIGRTLRARRALHESWAVFTDQAVSIATRAVRGAGWNLVTGVGSRIVALLGTLVLTRFISPGEYGEIAAATIAMTSAMLLTDASVGQSILARHASPGTCFHAFVLHMATGFLAVGAVFAFSAPLGGWLDAPHMVRFLPGFAVAALIERFAHVPGRILVRELRFRTVALGRGVGELVFTGVSLALAPRLQGYAIVIGNLARFTVIVTVFVLAVDRRDWLVPERLRWPVLKNLLAYGLPLTAGSLADFAAGNWDSMLLGHFYGTSTMGAYRLSRSLAETPITNLAEHLGDVLLPSFAKVDEARRRSGLVRATSIIALLVFPLCAGIAAVAPTLVRTLFDRRWSDLAPLLGILAIGAISRPMSWGISSFQQSQLKTRALMLIAFFKLGVTLALVATLGRLSPAWACVAVGLGGLLTLGLNILLASREGVPAAAFIGGFLRPTAACIPMYGAVVLVRMGLERLGAGGTLRSLAAEVAVGALVYVASAFAFARPIVKDATGLVRQALAHRAAPVGEPSV